MKQMKGSVKERWGKLTDDLDIINAKTNNSSAKFRKSTIAKDEAQRQVDD
jgi:uncharacterized protein YjbJ (UPF0337 family)